MELEIALRVTFLSTLSTYVGKCVGEMTRLDMVPDISASLVGELGAYGAEIFDTAWVTHFIPIDILK